MVEDISNFVRDNIYMPKVNLSCKTDRQPYRIPEYNNKAMVWLNLGKMHGYESRTRSKKRNCEVDEIAHQIRFILTKNIDIKSIGIITFYADQCDAIKLKLDTLNLTSKQKDTLQVGTIDAFQGIEFDVVFFSCSRCNDENPDNLQKKVGFLNDDNRLCVALSRGRNLIIGVGDSETVQFAGILGKYIETCKTDKGCYINV
jgi:hypothetical protein